jgi:hypothetical protein
VSAGIRLPRDDEEGPGEAPLGRREAYTARSPAARLLFWDYERGSLAYDLLCLLMLLFVLLAPPGWLGDPMVPRR